MANTCPECGGYADGKDRCSDCLSTRHRLELELADLLAKSEANGPGPGHGAYSSLILLVEGKLAALDNSPAMKRDAAIAHILLDPMEPAACRSGLGAWLPLIKAWRNDESGFLCHPVEVISAGMYATEDAAKSAARGQIEVYKRLRDGSV